MSLGLHKGRVVQLKKEPQKRAFSNLKHEIFVGNFFAHLDPDQTT
jgi:hypothetical protein